MSSFVRNLGSNGSSSATSLAVTIGAGVSIPAGDTIFVRAAYDGTTSPTIADSKGNTWSLDVGGNSASYGSFALFRCYVSTPLTTGDTITLTFGVANHVAMVADEFTGVLNSAPTQTSASGQGNSASIAAGSITTTVSGELILGFGDFQNQLTYLTITEPSSPWNALTQATSSAGSGGNSAQRTVYGSYQFQSAAGAIAYSATANHANGWEAYTVAYAVQASGGAKPKTVGYYSV